MKTTIEWIACADRLPERSTQYLVSDGQFVLGGWYFQNGCWCDLEQNNLNGVTHWAALPDPPSVGVPVENGDNLYRGNLQQ